MKNQIIFAIPAIVLLIVSIFAYSSKSENKPVARDCSNECPTTCCEYTKGQCDPSACDYSSCEGN